MKKTWWVTSFSAGNRKAPRSIPGKRFSKRKELIMSRFWKILSWRIGTNASDVRIQQWLCFAAAPAVLVLSGLALSKSTTDTSEAITGFLAASAVAVSFVILGVVAPLTQRRPAEQSGEREPPITQDLEKTSF
jgi:hypothetical protein